MAENQHSDNLERFFKANLEGYSPKPSDDFWSRMEPVIPAKPPFWSGWASGAGKWFGLAVLAILTLVVLWFWQRDRSQISRLKKTVAQQEQRIQAMDAASQSTKMTHPANEKTDLNAMNPASQITAKSAHSSASEAIIPSSKKAFSTANQGKNAPVAKQKKEPKLGQQPVDLKVMKTVQQAGKQSGEMNAELSNEQLAELTPMQKLENEGRSEASVDGQLFLETPSFLPSRNTQLSHKSGRTLIVKYAVIRPQYDFPRFSVEAGATAFRLPLGRLFQQDTFLTGRTGLSYGTGFKVNYELNSSTALQVGYQFTNLRARRLALRYNSFPVAVQKRFAWGHRSHIEAKLGASINSLVSARTDSDGQSVKGLIPTWFGFHVGIAAAWKMSEKLSFVTGPNAGFSLTPMTAGRRSWEIGVGAGLRYQL